METLGEQTTPQQMSLAREVLEFVREQVGPHARAEEYTLYPAADWAAGEGSRITEVPRFEHQLVSRRCEALDKAIQAGSTPGRLMHLCYSILGLIAAHFVTTEEVILPYLDKAFDPDRFDRPETAEAQRSAYLPFSTGPRVCLGAAFAMQESTLILAELVRRFRFDPVEGCNPVPRMRLSLRADREIRLRVSERRLLVAQTA